MKEWIKSYIGNIGIIFAILVPVALIVIPVIIYIRRTNNFYWALGVLLSLIIIILPLWLKLTDIISDKFEEITNALSPTKTEKGK